MFKAAPDGWLVGAGYDHSRGFTDDGVLLVFVCSTACSSLFWQRGDKPLADVVPRWTSDEAVSL